MAATDFSGFDSALQHGQQIALHHRGEGLRVDKAGRQMMQFDRFLARNSSHKRRAGGPLLELGIREQSVAKKSPAAPPVSGCGLLVRPCIGIG